MAASKDAGPVRGPDTGRRLERVGTPNGKRARHSKPVQRGKGNPKPDKHHVELREYLVEIREESP